MDFNVARQIDSSCNPLPFSNTFYISSSPSLDFVNPGVSNIARIHSHYVPIYQNSSNVKTKKIESTELVGGGSDKLQEQNGGSEMNKNDTTSELNNSILSKLDSKVKSSFLNPHFVETGSININSRKRPGPSSQKESQQSIVPSKKSFKTVPHKFQFF